MAIRRYLTAYSGIPLIYWNGIENRLECPYPYGFIASTDGSNNRFAQIGRNLDADLLDSVIRYDKAIDNIEQALVMTNLSTHAQLLAAHYQINQRPLEGE